MSLVDNEQRKLTAGYLNTIAAATMITGVVAPAIATTYDLPGPKVGLFAGLCSFIWFLISVGLHWCARRLMKGLRS